MLDTDELLILEERFRSESDEKLLFWLSKLNRTGELESWLEMVGLSSLITNEPWFRPHKTGIIVVIGETKLKKNDLLIVAKKMGFEKDRFEFYLTYEELKKKDFNKMRYDSSYSLILVGPTPHKGKTMEGGYSSIITAMEQKEGYPPVRRLGNNELKITKATFVEALEDAQNKRWIA